MKIAKRVSSLLFIGTILGIAMSTQVHRQQVTAATGVATVHYVKGYGIALWDSPNPNRHLVAGRKLMDGTSWKFSNTMNVNGITWYKLGTNQWANGTYFKIDSPTEKTTDVLHINYIPGYGVLLRQSPDGPATIPNQFLKHGTNWKIAEKRVVHGKTWYSLGKNQWLDGQYAVMGLAAKSTEHIAQAYLIGKVFDAAPKYYDGIPVDTAMNLAIAPQNTVHDGALTGYFKTSTIARVTGLGNYKGVMNASYIINDNAITIRVNQFRTIKTTYKIINNKPVFNAWQENWQGHTVTLTLSIDPNPLDRKYIDEKPLQY